MNKNIDYWNRILAQPKPIYQELFKQEAHYLGTHIDTGSSVLDIGCGDGRVMEYILPVTKDVTGLDIDPKAIELAREKFSSNPNLQLIEGDVFSLPFPAKSFDVVTLMLTLVNLDDRKTEALQEMKRVVKDNGKLIVSVYSEDALENRLEQYKSIELPIKALLGSKVILEKFSETSMSEQLSLSDLEQIANEADVKIQNVVEVPGIAYIFELVKG